MRIARALPLALFLFGGLGLAACTAGGGGGPAPAASPNGRLPAIAGFYPLAEVTRAVGGERVDVVNLVPSGGEPHDYELTPRDLDRLRQARLLVYLGQGFQPALERAVQSVQTPSLRTVDLLDGLALVAGGEDHEAEPTETAAEHAIDPHVWLDPRLMKDITAKVRDALVAIDPDGRITYEQNAGAYQAKLDALDEDFRQGLSNCRRREFITSHAAFSYLARRYNLEQIPARGLSPELEPSPQRIQRVISLAEEHDIKVIYFETLVNPRVAETIAREVGAEVKVLNPIEGLTPEQEARSLTYLDLMRETLTNLRAGLECA